MTEQDFLQAKAAIKNIAEHLLCLQEDLELIADSMSIEPQKELSEGIIRAKKWIQGEL